jgi:hypothetical protein
MSPVSKFTEILSVGAALIGSDRRTDSLTKEIKVLYPFSEKAILYRFNITRKVKCACICVYIAHFLADINQIWLYSTDFH